LSRARARAGARNPPALDRARSVVVDVDVDLVGNVDRGLAPAEAKLPPEQEQQYQNDDDEKDDGENSASTATARFHDGRSFAVVAIIGHGNSPCDLLL
jgi:hypothetical protein